MTKDEIDAVIVARIAQREIELVDQQNLSRTALNHSLNTYKLGMLDLRDALLAERCTSKSTSGFSCELETVTEL